MRLEARQGRGQIYFRAFVGLLLRDTRVLRRQVFAISARTLINPLLFVFVFTYLFPKIGQEVAAGRGNCFATVVLPGLGAVSIMFQGIATVALPLAIEFGTTREIEDRVMTPLPVSGGALARIVFSTAHGWVAAAVVFPLVYMSEGLRAALTPELPHMPTGAVVGALALLTVVLTWAGIRGFLRRVLT